MLALAKLYYTFLERLFASWFIKVFFWKRKQSTHPWMAGMVYYQASNGRWRAEYCLDWRMDYHTVLCGAIKIVLYVLNCFCDPFQSDQICLFLYQFVYLSEPNIGSFNRCKGLSRCKRRLHKAESDKYKCLSPFINWTLILDFPLISASWKMASLHLYKYSWRQNLSKCRHKCTLLGLGTLLKKL